MVKLEPLLIRIRGEFREMPGLRLTLPQACRLWHLDRATCESALHALVREHFLHQMQDGAYIAWPLSRATPAKAAVRPRAQPRPA